MSAIDDWIMGGISPRRDHSPKIAIRLRNVRMSARMGTLPDKGFGPTRDKYAREFPDMKAYGAPDDTVGDDECWGLWPFDNSDPDNREIPGWANAWPSEIEPAIQASDSGGAPALTGATVSPVEQSAFPVRTAKWDVDTRFAKKKVSLHPSISRLPKEWPGIVIPGTEERRQDDLFFPAGSGPLIAPWHAGDPELGTWVHDATALNELDFDRRAHLQSAFRVYKIPKTCGPNLWGNPGARGIAIQMALARGNFAGRAVFADFPETDMTVNSRAQALAAGSQWIGGCLHVGFGPGDQHTDATNDDGDTHGPLHFNPLGKWALSPGKDAPFLFTNETFRAHDGPGILREAKLVYDPVPKHPTPCGPKDGYFRWQVRIPIYVPPPPPPERPPPPGLSTVPGAGGDVDLGTIPGFASDEGFTAPWLDSSLGTNPAADGGFTTNSSANPDADQGFPTRPQDGGGGGLATDGSRPFGQTFIPQGANTFPGPPPIGEIPPFDVGPFFEPGEPGFDALNDPNVPEDVKAILRRDIGFFSFPKGEQGFGDTPDPAAPFGTNFFSVLTAGAPKTRSSNTPPWVQQGARARRGTPLTPVKFVNEVHFPGIAIQPQHFSTVNKDLRFSLIWDEDDAKKVFETTPAIGIFQGVGAQYGTGWSRTTGARKDAGAGLPGRYPGGTASGTTWFTQPEVGLEDVFDGKIPKKLSTTGLGFFQTRLGFGTPLQNGGFGTGFFWSGLFTDGNKQLILQETGGDGSSISTQALNVNAINQHLTLYGQRIVSEPAATPNGDIPIADGTGGYSWGTPPTATGASSGFPKNYKTGLVMSYTPSLPSIVNVTPGACRDTTDSQDIRIGGDPPVDYLTNGGPLFNDALIGTDTIITGFSNSGNWNWPGGGNPTFGNANLSGDIRPLLKGFVLAGTVAVRGRLTQTDLQKITGTGTDFTKLSVGDIIGNGTTGHGMIAQIDSPSVCWIVKEFTDLSSTSYTNQSFMVYPNVCVKVGVGPSVRISEIGKTGNQIYGPTLFNNGTTGVGGLAVIVGQPAAQVRFAVPFYPGTKDYGGTIGSGSPIVGTSFVYLWARKASGGATTLSWSTQRVAPYTPATLATYTIVRRVASLPIGTDNFVPPFSHRQDGAFVFEAQAQGLGGPGGPAFNVNCLNGASTSAFTTNSAALQVPPTSTRCELLAQLFNSTNNVDSYFRIAGVADPAVVNPTPQALHSISSTAKVSQTFLLSLDATQSFEHADVVGGGTTSITGQVVAWWDDATDTTPAAAPAQPPTTGLPWTIGGALDGLPVYPFQNLASELVSFGTSLTTLNVRRGTAGTSGTTQVQLYLNGVAVPGAVVSFVPGDAGYETSSPGALKTAAFGPVSVVAGDRLSYTLISAESGAMDLIGEAH